MTGNQASEDNMHSCIARYFKAGLSHKRIIQKCFSRRFNSEEHRNSLQEALDGFPNIKFIPYQATSLFGTSFSSGKLDLRTVIFDNKGNIKDPRLLPSKDLSKYTTYSVGFKALFKNGFKMFKSVIETGRFELFDQEQDGYLPALAALSNYLKMKEFHDKCLSAAVNFNDEVHVATILAVHLFSKLVLDDQPSYMVTSDYALKYRICPCGSRDCKYNVIYGNTLIGSEALFHGKPDIVLFPNGAGSCSVIVPKVKRDEELLELQNWDDDSDKQMVEVKTNRARLQNPESIKQISSLAINFSFYQRLLQHERLVPSSEIITTIPTIAVCQDSFDIYIYDTENDIFLRNKTPISIWDIDENGNYVTNLSSVLCLWMVVNHLTFKPRIPKAMSCLSGSSGFMKQLSDDRKVLLQSSLRMASKIRPIQEQDELIEKSNHIEIGEESGSESEKE